MSDGTRSLLRNIAGHLCAIGVAGLFLYAAKAKIEVPRQFVIDLRNYHILPESLLHLVAIFMPWWEVAAAVALVIPKTRRAGAILIAGMLVAFIAAVSYAALYRGYSINCGCFGKDSAEAGVKTIALDVGLLIATALAVYVPTKKRPSLLDSPETLGLDAAPAN